MRIQIIKLSELEKFFQAEKIAEEFMQSQKSLATAQKNLAVATANLKKQKLAAKAKQEILEVNHYAMIKVLGKS